MVLSVLTFGLAILVLSTLGEGKTPNGFYLVRRAPMMHDRVSGRMKSKKEAEKLNGTFRD